MATCQWGTCTEQAVGTRSEIPSCQKHLDVPTGLQRIENLAYGWRVNDKEKRNLLMLLGMYRVAKNLVELSPEMPDSVSRTGVRNMIALLESK